MKIKSDVTEFHRWELNLTSDLQKMYNVQKLSKMNLDKHWDGTHCLYLSALLQKKITLIVENTKNLLPVNSF